MRSRSAGREKQVVDRFASRTKVLLAQHAGLTCSNPDCRVFTGGPHLSIGEAAHITAASSDGPRYDRLLTPQQRGSYSNGIWLCRNCHRLIDSDERSFPTKLLHLWKQVAERRAHAFVGKVSPFVEDLRAIGPARARLIELPFVRNVHELHDIVADQSYAYPTTLIIREQIAVSESPVAILDMASELIIAIWQSNPEAAGILATALSTAFDRWEPGRDVLDKLKCLCRADLMERDYTRVGAIEPLAFTLAAKGHAGIHRKFLGAVIESEPWKEADSTRIGFYYGSPAAEAAAINRHLNDPLRSGALRANDTARLMRLVARPTTELARPRIRAILGEMLRQSVDSLWSGGEIDLAVGVIGQMTEYGFDVREKNPASGH
jgi:hypothetical protein